MTTISERAKPKPPIQEMPAHEQDIAERFRLCAEEWADADAAFYMLDNTTGSIRSEIQLKLVETGMAMNKAEAMSRASPEYRDHVAKAADAKVDYVPGWPAIDGIAADMSFDTGMKIADGRS